MPEIGQYLYKLIGDTFDFSYLIGFAVDIPCLLAVEYDADNGLIVRIGSRLEIIRKLKLLNGVPLFSSPDISCLKR